jgi:hypothetical protein
MGTSLLSSHSDRIKKLHQLVSQLQAGGRKVAGRWQAGGTI